jgi:hypothetical protein
MGNMRTGQSSSWKPPIQAKASPQISPPIPVENDPQSGEAIGQMPPFEPLGADWAERHPLMRSLAGDRPNPPVNGHPVPQAKLSVGEAGDRYEQQADRVARQVVSRLNAPTPSVQTQSQFAIAPTPEITVMRNGTENANSQNLSANVEQNIQNSQGTGKRLEEGIREPMEREFNADFGGVKIHADGNSDRLNRSLNARAFTTGQDIYFKQGEYNPSNPQGQELLAHELTHVVQQNGSQVRRSPQIQNTSTPLIQTKPALIHHRKGPEKQDYARIYQKQAKGFQAIGRVDNDTKIEIGNETELYHNEVYVKINDPQYEGKWIKNSNLYYLHPADSGDEATTDTDRVYRQLLLLNQAWNDWKAAMQNSLSAQSVKQLVQEELGVTKLKKVPKKQRTAEIQKIIKYVRSAKKETPVIEKEAYKKYKQLQKETATLLLEVQGSDDFDDAQVAIVQDAYQQVIELPEVADRAIRLREFVPVKSGAAKAISDALEKRTALLAGTVSSAELQLEFGLSLGLPIVKIEPTLTIGGKLWVAQDRKFRAKTSVNFNVAFKVSALNKEAFKLAGDIFGADIDVYDNPQQWIDAKADKIARFYVKLKHLAASAMSDPTLYNETAEEFGLAEQGQDIASPPGARPNVKVIGGGAAVTGSIPSVVSAGISGTKQALHSRKPPKAKGYEGKVLKGKQVIFKGTLATPAFNGSVTATWTTNHLNPLNDGSTIDVQIDGFPVEAVGSPQGSFTAQISTFLFKDGDPSMSFEGLLTSGDYESATEGITSAVNSWADNLGKSAAQALSTKIGVKRKAGLELRWQKPPEFSSYKLQYLKTFKMEQLSVSQTVPTGTPGVDIKFGMKAKRYDASSELIFANGLPYLMQTYGGLKAWGKQKEKWEEYKKQHDLDLKGIFKHIREVSAEKSDDEVIAELLPNMTNPKPFLNAVKGGNLTQAIAEMEKMFDASIAQKVETQKEQWEVEDPEAAKAAASQEANASPEQEQEQDKAEAENEQQALENEQLIQTLLDDPRTFEAYEKDLLLSGSSGGKWADHYEIAAVAKGLGARLQMHQLNGKTTKPLSTYGNGEPTYHLLVEGNLHYAALIESQQGTIAIGNESYKRVPIPPDGDCFYASVSTASWEDIAGLRQLALQNMSAGDRKASITSALRSLALGDSTGIGVNLKTFYEGFFEV